MRPYSNSLEACFTAAGVFYWLRQQAGGSSSSSSKALAAADDERRWLLLAGLCVVFRPSSALFWLLPASLALAQTRNSAARLVLAVHGLAAGAACLAVATLLDRVLYGRWVLVPWQFLKFNLLAGGSALYGSHPWHWNASQGAPVVALTLLPLAAAGLRVPLPAKWARGRLQLAWLLSWQLLMCSLPAHKEFRFLLPALQLTVPLCGLGATWLTGGASGSLMRRDRQLGAGAPADRSKHWWLPMVLLALQLPVALYFCLFHHSGNVAVMGALRKLAAARAPEPTSALFLTPCHATPYSTHVHVRSGGISNGTANSIALRFFDCSPPGWAHAVAALNTADQAWLSLPEGCLGRDEQQHQAWRSQRQCFEADPERYLGSVLMAAETKAGVGSGKPTALVGYSRQMGRLTGMLQQHGYQQYKTWANCLLQTDPDTSCGLELWVREDV